MDNYLISHKKPIGPLHGLPISVKEHIGMKNLDLNAGFVSWVGQAAGEDAHILQILWNAGAVFYARTTQPQSLMHLETSSNLYGCVNSHYPVKNDSVDNSRSFSLTTDNGASVTINPFNTTLTSGGSSGGEGALVGIRGSCLGIGTDIGGSIRSPAACNGIYGFKSTSYRLPTKGWSATMAGAEHIVPCIGPLSTSLAGIKLFMKTVIAAKPWLREPSLLPFQWNDKGDPCVERKRLKVAILWDDGIVKPHPPITMALQKVVERLHASEAFEIVDWNPYKHDLAWEIIVSAILSNISNSSVQVAPYREHSSLQGRQISTLLMAQPKNEPQSRHRESLTAHSQISSSKRTPTFKTIP